MFSSVKIFNINVNLFYVAIFCLLIIYNVARKVYIHRVTAQSLPVFYGLPFFGIIFALLPLDATLNRITRYIKLFKFSTAMIWAGNTPLIVTIEPDLLKHVLSSDEFLNKAGIFYDALDAALPNGLITSSYVKWKHNRKLISPLFTPIFLRQYMPRFIEGSKSIVHGFESLCDGKEHDVFTIIRQEFLKITLGTTMGSPQAGDKEVELRFLHSLYWLMYKIALGVPLHFLNLLFLSRTTGYHKLKDNLISFIQNLINRKLEASSSLGGVTFLDRALQYEEQKLFDRNDVLNESITIMIGAMETTALTLYSLIIFLAMHQDVQQKVYQEIIETVGYNEDMDPNYFNRLQYLNMVIDETLRLVPPITFIGRQALNSCNLTKDIKLFKGAQVLISIYHLHRRQELWGPNAELFNPDNFLPENVEKRHPYAYIPFSKGIRNCVGMRYGQTVLKVLAVNLIKEFQFFTEFPYCKLHFAPSVTIRYVKEPKIRVVKRTV